MGIDQSWSTKATEVVAPVPRKKKKKKMVEEQNLTSPRNVPLVPPTGKAEHCSRWQKNYLQGPAAVSQSRAKKGGFEAQRQKEKKKNR